MLFDAKCTLYDKAGHYWEVQLKIEADNLRHVVDQVEITISKLFAVFGFALRCNTIKTRIVGAPPEGLIIYIDLTNRSDELIFCNDEEHGRAFTRWLFENVTFQTNKNVRT